MSSRGEDVHRKMWRDARRRARRYSIPFTITTADVIAAWPIDGLCPALGLEFSRGLGSSHDASPTLDRLNSAWGYEPGNIAVISHRANRAKSSLTAGELERVAAWMRARGLN